MTFDQIYKIKLIWFIQIQKKIWEFQFDKRYLNILELSFYPGQNLSQIKNSVSSSSDMFKENYRQAAKSNYYNSD